MTLKDYINSDAGLSIIQKWAGIATIATILAMTIVMGIRGNWKDFPSGTVALLSIMLGLICGNALIAKAIEK